MHTTRQCCLLSIFMVCTIAVLAGKAWATDDQEAQATIAWQSLKAGNAVVLMRHALAPGVGDPPQFDLERCSTQRNLSDVGRMQARAIGDVLRANGIVEATILSSEWCRCMETAALLSLGDPRPAPMLNSFFEDRQTEHEQTQTLKDSLGEWLSPDGEVRILVTHQVNISSLTGQFASSGDMLIVTLKNNEPVVLARISTDG